MGDAFDFRLSLDGQEFSVVREDLIVEEQSPEGISAARMGDGFVAFDTKLTEELILEGKMRDFLRKMQVKRKDIGLEIEDRIEISYRSSSAGLASMLEKFKEFICGELLCVKMEAAGEGSALLHRLDIGEDVVEVEVKKVSRL
jgi:isoleucyl-tRNA synthetase